MGRSGQRRSGEKNVAMSGPVDRRMHAASELRTALAACRGAFIGIALMSGMINLLYLTGAALRFSAFNQRTTPELNGELSRISADLSSDQRTGANYYTVRITLPDSELARLGGLKLVPGMPVEAFIKTGERTMLSYFTKPLM